MDVIMMLNVIEHITKEKLLELVADIHRVLRIGGIYLVQTGNLENPFNLGLYSRDFTHHVLFIKNSIIQLMVMSGFLRKDVFACGVNYRTTLRNLPLQIISPIMKWLLKVTAMSMRMRINETKSLIIFLTRKKVIYYSTVLN